MSELYNRIERLCKDRNINMTAMCKEASVPRGNLSDLKMGRSAILSTKNLSKIAAYFDVSVDFLLGQEEQKNKPADQTVSELDAEFMRLFSGLSDQQKDFVLVALRGMQSGE